MERDHFTREEAESRLRSQMDPAEKARRADVVIDTSGSIRYTRDSIPPLLAEERRLAALQRSNHGTCLLYTSQRGDGGGGQVPLHLGNEPLAQLAPVRQLLLGQSPLQPQLAQLFSDMLLQFLVMLIVYLFTRQITMGFLLLLAGNLDVYKRQNTACTL